MTDPAASEKNPWYSIITFFTRKLMILQVIANLAGAGIVTSYFMFFDTNLKVQRITNDLIVIGIMFVGLVIIATVFLNRWQKDLMHFVNLKIHKQDVDSDLRKRVQRNYPTKIRYECQGNPEQHRAGIGPFPATPGTGRRYHAGCY